VLTPIQREAVVLLSNNGTVLLEGGSRSGKTYLALRTICKRAMDQRSDHLITRYRFAHAKQSICYQTMPAVLESIGLGGLKPNKSDWFYEFPNGSTCWIGGLDEKDRTEKILGNEYATIFENEASQITYDSHEMLATRLNPPAGMRALNIIDYNPPHVRHWGYSIFHLRRFPDGRPVPVDDYARIKMNPVDNPHLSADYIERLGQLSVAKRKRFLEGAYGDDEGKLWRREWIRYAEPPATLQRIVVGVDPSGTKRGDEVGIVVAALHADGYSVIGDYSLHGTPAEWSAEVARAYAEHRADSVVAEANYGGEMVEHTIRASAPDLRVELVHATRGKAVRAEPISALYERGKVTHAHPMIDLEDEMCMFDPLQSASPNRMDALVWAMSALVSTIDTTTPARVSGRPLPRREM
jgi:hypothetical protein